MLAKWKLTAATGNFPMALEETNQRLFIGCRNPAKLLALNTVSGQIVADTKVCGDTDDLFFDSVDQQCSCLGEKAASASST